MSKLVQSAAEEIQLNLADSEAGIDLAIASSAMLLASMTTARVNTSSPFGTGQVAIMRLMKTLGALTDARTDMARVHADLLRVGQERGDYATLDECPNGVARPDETGLKLVA